MGGEGGAGLRARAHLNLVPTWGTKKKKKSNRVRRAKKALERKKNEGPNKSICRTTHSK